MCDNMCVSFDMCDNMCVSFDTCDDKCDATLVVESHILIYVSHLFANIGVL